MAEARASRGTTLILVAVVAVCAVVLAGIVLQSYRTQSTRRPPAPPPAAEAPVQPAPPPTPEPEPVSPLLDRAAFLAAASVAAANYSAGAPAPEQPAPLVGRRFRLRLPFGCAGPAAPDEPATAASWSFTEDRQSIRIAVRAEDWSRSALVGELGGPDRFEAVEGFWIQRPWLASDGCPAQAADPLQAEPVAPSPETVGLAAFFEAGGSRVPRRAGRAYEAVIKLGEGAAAPAGGFRLVVEGRVAGYQDGRAFRCRAAHPDQRPVCIARVQIDTVAVEDPAAAQVLATWETGQLTASGR